MSVGALLVTAFFGVGEAAADSKPSANSSSAKQTDSKNAKTIPATFKSEIAVVVHVTFNKESKLGEIKSLTNGYGYNLGNVAEGTKVEWEATPVLGDRASIGKCSGKATIDKSHDTIVLKSDQCEAHPAGTANVTFENVSDGMAASLWVEDKLRGVQSPLVPELPAAKISGKPSGLTNKVTITVAKDPGGKINITAHIKCHGMNGVKLVPGIHDDADYTTAVPIQVIDGCNFRTQ
jgi:hypothetical protein